jgi:hypothetical protein
MTIMAVDIVRLIFYEGVHDMPSRVFAERIFTLFTSGGLPEDTHTSLAEQGVSASDYINAVPSISHR